MSASTVPAFRLSGYYFFYFAFIGVFSPYFSLYLQDLGFSAWDIGLLMSQMQLMRLVGPYVWGWLADRGRQRLSIIRLAGLLSLLGFSAFFWLRALGGMMVAMAILAFFWSAALPLVEALTFDHLRQQPQRYGRIRLWGSVGFIVAVQGTGYLLDQMPLSGVLWVCWGLLLGIWVLSWGLPEAARRGLSEGVFVVGDILRQRRVRGLLAACFCMSAAHGALYVFYSIHAAALGYSKAMVGMLWSLGVVAEILVFVVMPRVLRRYPLRGVLLACFGAAALRFWVIGWWLDVLWVALAAQTLHALTFGAFHAASIAAVNRWFQGNAQGRGQALYSSLSFGAGGLLGGLLSGALWDVWGAGWTYTLSGGLALVGAAWVSWGIAADEAMD